MAQKFEKFKKFKKSFKSEPCTTPGEVFSF